MVFIGRLLHVFGVTDLEEKSSGIEFFKIKISTNI